MLKDIHDIVYLSVVAGVLTDSTYIPIIMTMCSYFFFQLNLKLIETADFKSVNYLQSNSGLNRLYWMHSLLILYYLIHGALLR